MAPPPDGRQAAGADARRGRRNRRRVSPKKICGTAPPLVARQHLAARGIEVDAHFLVRVATRWLRKFLAATQYGQAAVVVGFLRVYCEVPLTGRRAGRLPSSIRLQDRRLNLSGRERHTTVPAQLSWRLEPSTVLAAVEAGSAPSRRTRSTWRFPQRLCPSDAMARFRAAAVQSALWSEHKLPVWCGFHALLYAPLPSGCGLRGATSPAHVNPTSGFLSTSAVPPPAWSRRGHVRLRCRCAAGNARLRCMVLDDALLNDDYINGLGYRLVANSDQFEPALHVLHHERRADQRTRCLAACRRERADHGDVAKTNCRRASRTKSRTSSSSTSCARVRGHEEDVDPDHAGDARRPGRGCRAQRRRGTRGTRRRHVADAAAAPDQLHAQ